MDLLRPIYLGLSAVLKSSTVLEIGFCYHDGTYALESVIREASTPEVPSQSDWIIVVEDYITTELSEYSHRNGIKIVGAGITKGLVQICPTLCSALWRQLDIVPLLLPLRTAFAQPNQDHSNSFNAHAAESASLQAHSVVRKCISCFGPNHLLRVQVGAFHAVEVDAGFRARLVSSLEDYRSTVGPRTWNAVMKYATELKKSGLRIAYFSSTPQGGGVALMRHALMRFYHLLGINARWYVPKPDPVVFRITKTNHNILQGVASPSTRTSKEDIEKWETWLRYNANTYWTKDGGPLSKHHGADIIVVDDPQMPALIPIARQARPNVPIIYRSHIEMRRDLISIEGTPQEALWSYLWSFIQSANVFISHPVLSFIPANINPKVVGLLGASTDWLDGLNKELTDWDSRYYFQDIRAQRIDVKTFLYPSRIPADPEAGKYIAQISRFDPSKGIPDVLQAYHKLRQKLEQVMDADETPQLLVCGHGSVDDPDASQIYSETMALLRDKYAAIAPDVLLLRIGPSDQVLNDILSHCHIALQLSIREGFEVKVSEALHKGKPVVATRAGGIPLQVRHGHDGFIVEPGDTAAAAEHLYQLVTDHRLHQQMSENAKKSVSDEVSTVGSAVSWLYLFTKLAKRETIDLNQQWIYHMARTECGEDILPEEFTLSSGGAVAS